MAAVAVLDFDLISTVENGLFRFTTLCPAVPAPFLRPFH